MEIPKGEKKKKILSLHTISIGLLIIGFIMVIGIILLNVLKVSDANAKIDYLVYLIGAIGILLAGILISLLSLSRLFERVG